MRYNDIINTIASAFSLSVGSMSYGIIKLNYNSNVAEEIPELDAEPNVYKVPVLLSVMFKDQQTDKDVIEKYPGFLFQKVNNGEVTDMELKMAVTEEQLQEYEYFHNNLRFKPDQGLSEISLDQWKFYSVIDLIGYAQEETKLIIDYIVGDTDTHITSLSPYVYAHFELHELTYVDMKTLTYLRDKRIGKLLSVNSKLPTEQKDPALSKVEEVVRRAMTANIEVFKTLSSARPNRRKSFEDLMLSDSNPREITKMAINTNLDPLASTHGKRNSGNLLGWLPTFNKSLLQFMTLGNFPIFVITDTEDPMYMVKVYIFQMSEYMVRLRKSKQKLTPEAQLVLDNNRSILKTRDIRSLYNMQLSKDGEKAYPLNFKRKFQLYFVNFAIARIVLGEPNIQRVENVLNYIIPLEKGETNVQ